MAGKKMRYCVVEFRGPKDRRESEQHTIPIEFGFYYQQDKVHSIKTLREQYSDYKLVKTRAIKKDGA